MEPNAAKTNRYYWFSQEGGSICIIEKMASFNLLCRNETEKAKRGDRQKYMA